MFNEEQKLRFIKDTAKSASYQRSTMCTLRFAENFEHEWDKDICEWTKEQLVTFLMSRKHTSAFSARNEILVLKRYIDWCIANNCTTNKNVAKEIKATDLIDSSSAKDKMVSDPANLKTYLDDLFDTQQTAVADEISTFRMYYWFAFAGVPEEYVDYISAHHIAKDDMLIVYNNERFPLYDECVQDMETVLRISSGTPIIKLFHKTATIKTISNYMARRKNKSVLRMSYRNVRHSGLFYRMYQREKIGFPVTFDDEIEKNISKHEYTGYGDTALKNKVTQNRRRQLREALLSEYATWKAAFNLK